MLFVLNFHCDFGCVVSRSLICRKLHTNVVDAIQLELLFAREIAATMSRLLTLQTKLEIFVRGFKLQLISVLFNQVLRYCTQMQMMQCESVDLWLQFNLNLVTMII